MMLVATEFEPTVIALVEFATLSLNVSTDHTNTTFAVLLPTSIATVALERSPSAYAFALVDPHVVLVANVTVS